MCSNSEKLKILKKILGLDIYESIFNNIKDYLKDLNLEYKLLDSKITESQNIINSKNTIITNIQNLKHKLNHIQILENNQVIIYNNLIN